MRLIFSIFCCSFPFFSRKILSKPQADFSEMHVASSFASLGVWCVRNGKEPGETTRGVHRQLRDTPSAGTVCCSGCFYSFSLARLSGKQSCDNILVTSMGNYRSPLAGGNRGQMGQGWAKSWWGQGLRGQRFGLRGVGRVTNSCTGITPACVCRMQRQSMAKPFLLELKPWNNLT